MDMFFFWAIQLVIVAVIGLYIYRLMHRQRGSRKKVVRDSQKELDKLEQMRQKSLSEPLSEKTRPASFSEIIGQEESLEALEASLCGPNPQHVLIYGPPGVGKTAAARLVLEIAKRNRISPFKEDARFVEMDATTARFDERGIADPLIGSVHDPIYQGAGAMGVAGIPQPKPGAVTRAHGGILFIDEIGELHPIQMNKLLKVLEDRKVFLESAYYNEEDRNIPQYVHEIFKKGLPADFRLVGATTRSAQDIPPAIRSRCLEIYFRGLTPDEVSSIVVRAAEKIQVQIESAALEVIKKYASNGREGVNIVQIAAGIAAVKGRVAIIREDVERVINSGQYSPRLDKKINSQPKVGIAHGLAVQGPNMGILLDVEVVTAQAKEGEGRLKITGVIEEEEIGSRGHVLKRKSMVKNSLEIVLTVLDSLLSQGTESFHIHVNFPGGIPIDGPSAGLTLAVAIYSSLTGKPVDNKIAMTGEISLGGEIKGVGGVGAKIEAARQAGAKKILIPQENWQESYAFLEGAQVKGVISLEEALKEALISTVPPLPPLPLPGSL